MNTIAATYKTFIQNISPIFGEGEARSIARIVFEDEFQIHNFQRTQEFPLASQTRLQEIEARLLKNEPIQYILGQADFYGLKFKVDKRVLIPRQETEELVAWVSEYLTHSPVYINILDIGTGSGCIPIALKHKFPEANIHAVDVSSDALALAKENAGEREIHFHELDMLEEKEWQQLDKFDYIISNPPYIPTEESDLMPAWVRLFEPLLALFVEDKDPLLFYKRIADFALVHLYPEGQLFFECNEFNAQEVADMLSQKGFENVEIRKDLNGKNRMLKGDFC